MARRRHLVAYDIANPKRLRRICKIMEGYGDRLQYSVFVCDLSPSELVALRWDVRRVMRFEEDSVVIVDLGNPTTAKFEFIGQHRKLPEGGVSVV